MLGLTVGAGVALLVAPKSGRELRQQLVGGASGKLLGAVPDEYPQPESAAEWGGPTTAVAEPPSVVEEPVTEEAAPTPKPFPDWDESPAEPTGEDLRARIDETRAALESELAEPFADRTAEQADEAATVADDAVVEAVAAEVVAEEAVVDAAAAEIVAEEAVAEAEAAEGVAEEAVNGAVAAELDAEDAVADALLADDADAAAAEQAAEVAIEEADAATAVAEQAVAEADVAELVAETAIVEATAAEIVAQEAVTEAVVDEVVAEEAVEEADLAETVAEEVAAEEAVADEVVAEAPFAGEALGSFIGPVSAPQIRDGGAGTQRRGRLRPPEETGAEAPVVGAAAEGAAARRPSPSQRSPEPPAAEPAAAAEATTREGGGIDQAEMRRRIEETRARLKAKAFDAMMSGEAALLSRDSGEKPVPSADDVAIDAETDSAIDESLSQEDY